MFALDAISERDPWFKDRKPGAKPGPWGLPKGALSRTVARSPS